MAGGEDSLDEFRFFENPDNPQYLKRKKTRTEVSNKVLEKAEHEEESYGDEDNSFNTKTM